MEIETYQPGSCGGHRGGFLVLVLVIVYGNQRRSRPERKTEEDENSERA